MTGKLLTVILVAMLLPACSQTSNMPPAVPVRLSPAPDRAALPMPWALAPQMNDGASAMFCVTNQTSNTICVAHSASRPAVSNITLSWYFSGPIDGVVFIVRATNRLGLHPRVWPVIAITAERSYTLPATGSARFFALTASNIYLAHSESGLSR